MNHRDSVDVDESRLRRTQVFRPALDIAAQPRLLVYHAAMSTGQAEALDRAVARIVEAMRPEAIYLFGSHARGDARADSDYDLLVVVADDAPRDTRSLSVTTRVPRDPGISLDIVPCRRSVFERKRHHVGTLSYLTVHEGRLVYGH